MNILKETQSLVDELNATNSKSEKVAILDEKQCPKCGAVMTYEQYLVHFVKEDQRKYTQTS